jgi:hypothetical protein
LTASFIALYRGNSISSAKLVAVASEPDLVRAFADRMLAGSVEPEGDAAVCEIERGRRRALQVIRDEADG